MHFGEKKRMKNGLMAEIIAFRDISDIDIQFENGFILENIRYSLFLTRNIFITPGANRGASHIGETRLMNNGMRATVIAYQRSTRITVRFEDGVIVENQIYKRFMANCIEYPIKGENGTNPDLSPKRTTHSRQKRSIRIGETCLMNCGMHATIIAYRGYNDIDIQFEDGTIINGRRYDHFQNGKIGTMLIKQQQAKRKRIGETRQMHNGMTGKIIDYRGYNDIDVCFEDGSIAENRRYDAFVIGNIGHIGKRKKQRRNAI